MHFLRADKNNIAELVKIRLDYLIEDYGKIEDDVLNKIKSSLPDYYEQHLSKDFFAYIAKDDDKVVSSAFLILSEKPANVVFQTGRTGFVLNVYTKSDYRKHGIAKKLMKMLLSDAERFKLDFVELKASKDGYNLYKSIGFKEVFSEYTEMKYIIKE